MDIKPIRTKRDYAAAHESRHFPMDLPDPVAAIKFVMEQRNLTAKDRVPYIGQPNRVYLAMAWKLHKGLGIPAESLIRQAARLVRPARGRPPRHAAMEGGMRGGGRG